MALLKFRRTNASIHCNLNKHQDKAHGTKPSCPTCGKTYYDSRYLHNHFSQNACLYCGECESYVTKDLRAHVIQHGGFLCRLCNRRVSRESDYINHMKRLPRCVSNDKISTVMGSCLRPSEPTMYISALDARDWCGDMWGWWLGFFKQSSMWRWCITHFDTC